MTDTKVKGRFQAPEVRVTNFLEVEKGYTNVSKFNPSVIGNTGIDSYELIKSIGSLNLLLLLQQLSNHRGLLPVPAIVYVRGAKDHMYHM